MNKNYKNLLKMIAVIIMLAVITMFLFGCGSKVDKTPGGAEEKPIFSESY
jgi:outer membrane lipoprotein-sorting protein